VTGDARWAVQVQCTHYIFSYRYYSHTGKLCAQSVYTINAIYHLTCNYAFCENSSHNQRNIPWTNKFNAHVLPVWYYRPTAESGNEMDFTKLRLTQSVQQVSTNLLISSFTQNSFDNRFVWSRSKSASDRTQSIVQSCHVSCPTSGNKQVWWSRIPDESEGILRHFNILNRTNE